MPKTSPLLFRAALEDFHRLRRQAALRQLLTRVTGENSELLSYEDVESYLQPSEQVNHGLQEIPVAAIVGSVGRYQDFTRDFLPKKESDADRWARVKTAIMNGVPMPPIDVYQVGGVYFVKDGNHRVSVARQLGTETLTAYVTEVTTRVPLAPADDPTQVICKAQYTKFLAQTNLDQQRPQADLLMTYCGEYGTLLSQIATHHGWLQLKKRRPVKDAEAVADWYDRVYQPVVEMIRSQGIMHHFPDSTEADLYILLLRRRQELADSLGWQVDMETAVSALAEPAKSLKQRLLQAVVPEELDDGPAPGRWRQQRVAIRQHERLFRSILVPVHGTAADQHVVQEAVQLAQRENGRLLGLHVVAHQADAGHYRTTKIADAFSQQCRRAGVPHEFVVDVGDPVDTIVHRAGWTDLVVAAMSVAGRPAQQSTGIDMAALIQRSPCPVLALPPQHSPFTHALLAYDGSPKADEALIVATYMAHRWQIALTVITVETATTTAAASTQARVYLQEHGVQATFELRRGDIAGAIEETASACQANLVIMGGFGFRPMLHLVLGSAVDALVRQARLPLLVCR